MTTNERTQIVELMRRAGMATLRVQEVEDGCRLQRVRQILAGQMDGQDGTLTLSDPDAAEQAMRLAYSIH
jgi:hypothetical protein